MSKSATEQYQIKKKRKHNQNKAKNSQQVKQTNQICKNQTRFQQNNNKYKVFKKNTTTTGDALIKQITLTEFCLHQQQQLQQQQHLEYLFNNNNSSVNLVTPTKVIVNAKNVNSDVVATRQCAQCNKLDSDTVTQRPCCLRDHAQVLLLKSKPRLSEYNSNSNNNNISRILIRSKRNANSSMPLSQGFSAKVCVGGAIKRTASKPALPRQVEAAKRSKSTVAENFTRLAPQRHLHARHHANDGSNNKCLKGGSGSKFDSAYKCTTTALGATALLLDTGARYTSNMSTDLTPSNNLQFYYLLAESLTRYGSLLEAFDVYAFIASEQLDSCIPLDRLNTFASALITYVRQMGASANDSSQELFATSVVSANKLSDSTALESALKVKYESSSAGWSAGASGVVPCGITATTPPVPDAVVGAGLTDMHSPTRELLRVPSPTQSEDYDPLLCPLCNDILRCPVTTNCGHTFCRLCCDTITQCNICHAKFPRSSRDDFVSEVTGGARSYANTSSSTLTTLTTATTSSEAALSAASAYLMPAHVAAPRLSSSQQYASTSTSVFTNISTYAPTAVSNTTSSSNDNSLLRRRLQARTSLGATGSGSDGLETTVAPTRLQLLPTPSPTPTPPMTVTTATVASTTATATTTMASSASGGGAGIAASLSGSAANMKFMPDVLVRRLVEKWWGADLQAKKNNETAASYMHMHLLDDALKFCNASLEKSPFNFKSLLLRSEVLRKLNHFQSSLADVENALKIRHTSAKAHYLRALALCHLGRCDEALYDNCLAISLDKDTLLTSSELFQHDLAKNLHKLLAQTPKSKSLLQRTFNSTAAVAAAPYKLLAAEQQLRRRKQLALLSNANGDHLSSYDEEFIPYDSSKCDIVADSDYLTPMDATIGDVGGVGVGDDVGGGSANISGYISGIGDTLMDKRFSIYTGMEKHFDIELRRQASRKHFRRKWTPKETELMPTLSASLEEVHYSALFRNTLERVKQELQRLKSEYNNTQ
uniref:TPR repeat-containing protein MJ0940 n=1 Tax=Bactrocera latifrons TaxID=174628 RepID=A0A0K8UR96_BACLA